MTDRLTFGEIIRALRKKNKMTQKQLAKRAYIDFTYVSKIEHGALPGKDTVYALACVLEVNPEWLLAMSGRVDTAALKCEADKDARVLALLRRILDDPPTQSQWNAIVAVLGDDT